MRRSTCVLAVGLGSIVAAACGDSVGDTQGATETGSTSLPATSSSGTTATAPTTSSGTDSASGTTTTNTAPTTGDTSAGVTMDSTDSSGGFKFDAGVTPDAAGLDCTKQCSEADFSYIWIANSSQSTVSKIITMNAANSGEYGGIQGVA